MSLKVGRTFPDFIFTLKSDIVKSLYLEKHWKSRNEASPEDKVHSYPGIECIIDWGHRLSSKLLIHIKQTQMWRFKLSKGKLPESPGECGKRDREGGRAREPIRASGARYRTVPAKDKVTAFTHLSLALFGWDLLKVVNSGVASACPKPSLGPMFGLDLRKEAQVSQGTPGGYNHHLQQKFFFCSI